MSTTNKSAAKKATAKAAARKSSVRKGGAKTSSTPRARAQDRKLVAGPQKHEVRYEAKKENVSAGIVAGVVKAVGNARRKVEAAIEGFKSKRKPPVRKAPKSS